MRRKLPSVTICVLFITAIFISVDMGFEVVENVKGATIYVPTDYPTIQEAIDAARDGDTVFVCSRGLPYSEFPSILVDKSINLIGEDRDTTPIEGYIGCSAITIIASHVTISGFAITGIAGGRIQSCGIYVGGGYNTISGNNIYNIYGDAIDIRSSYNVITNNIIDVSSGITAYPGACQNTISSNKILRGGISCFSTAWNVITNNTISDRGIFITGDSFGHWTSQNIDSSNTINGKPICFWKNKDGGSVPQDIGQIILANCTNITIINHNFNYCGVGIELGFSSNIGISGTILSNNDYGIYMSHSNNNIVVDNTISYNFVEGIYLRYSNNNDMIGNFISNNGHWSYDEETEEEIIDAGITLVGSSSNQIYHNDFINNIVQAQDDRNDNLWDCGYPLGGNYWSDYAFLCRMWDFSYSDDYKGPNQDIPGSDGIGDIPYYWIDSNSCDNYPLMEPYNTPPSSNIPPVANSGGDQIVYANETVYFNGSSSSDPDDNFLIHSWDFGDGSPLSFEENPIHTYETAGIYYVTLTVWDKYRSKDSDTCVINVKPSFRIDLKEGWNLISFPSRQESTKINTVLRSIDGDYDIVQYYDRSDNNDHWKNHHIIKPSYMNDLHEINHEMGFWIHVTKLGGTNLNLGWNMLTETQNIHLYSGWNLVGYPAINHRIRDDALNNLKFGKDVDSIWTFNAITQKWFELGESDYFELGKGYWIHVKDDCDWLVFSPILNLNKNRYYSTIQDAIDVADPHDTIEISPGIYNDELTISKPITLLGKNIQTTIIKANINPVIKIMADDVTISNLNLSSGRYGIDILNSQNVQIRDLIIHDYILSGIHATDSSVNIQNNHISNDPDRTGGAGIKLTRCNDTIIEYNTVEDIVYSLYLMYSSATIKNNIISPADGYDDRQDSIGIALYFYSNATVIHNSITGGDVGIGVEFGSSPNIYDNTISNSEYYGILIKNSGSPTIDNNEIRDCIGYGIFSNRGTSININNNTLFYNEILLCDSSINNLELISGYASVINSSISNYDIKNEAELTVKWYMHVRVVNQKGYPIFGVMVMIRNNLGHLLGGNFNTDIDGYVKDIVVTEFWESNTGKIYYTPHNVTAVLGSHKVYANPEPWMNESKEVVIMVDHGGG